MASILIRTVIIYCLLMLTLRLMGRREIGQLDASDLVSTLLISELAAIPIDDPDIPLLNAVLPILFILCLEVILSTVKNKSAKLGRAIDGNACYIIYKGRLIQDSLVENRLSINEILSEMRQQGISDIADVYYAILEPGGKLSLLESYEGKRLAHPIIIDGKMNRDALREHCIKEDVVYRELETRGLVKDQVFLMTVNEIGEFKVIVKEKT